MKKSELKQIIKEEIQNILKEENKDNELNESIKHFQKLAGIITEEYGISTKETKSNDYYKKGMMFKKRK